MSLLTNSGSLSDLANNYAQNAQSVANGDNSSSGSIPIATVSSQMFTQFNNLVTAQTNAANCDASCIYEASLNALFKTMENARLNEVKAPYEYEQAEEAYYAFLGQSVPNNFQEQKINEKYNKIH